MIIAALLVAGLVFAVFVVAVIGIRATEKHHGLRNPYDDGLAGAFARRLLGVYVRQTDGRDQDNED